MGHFVSCLISNFLKIQCLEGGIWEQGSCVPVVCEPPSPVFEGMYECTNGFELNSQCMLNCNQESGRVRQFELGFGSGCALILMTNPRMLTRNDQSEAQQAGPYYFGMLSSSVDIIR